MEQSKSVAAWLESYDNPMNEVVRRVRDIILRADARIRESLDGNAPTFSYGGTLASIFPESKKHASLMVPRGAEIPGHHPRLEGSGDTGRVMKIGSLSEANAAKDDLQHLVRAWCDWRDAEGAGEDVAEAEAEETGTTKSEATRLTEPAAKKARPAAKKAGKPATKKTSAPAAKKAGKAARKKAGKAAAKKAGGAAAKKARGAPAKKGGKPAAQKAQRPAGRKTAKPATSKGRGGRRGS